MPMAFTITLVTLISCYTCYRVAKNRRANIAPWVVLGALIGPLAIPFVFFAKPKTLKGT